MKILDRKLRRDLARTRGLLAAVVAIVTVGTGSFVGMLSTFNNLLVARTSYYSQCRMADFWINLKKAPVVDVERLGKQPGVSDIRERIGNPVIVDIENVGKPISGLALSLPDNPAPVINNIIMRRGSYFTDDRRNQVIISEKFAEAWRISPGSFIHLVMNGQRKQLFVIGTAISSEHIYLAPPGGIVDDPYEYGVFYLKRSYAEDMFGFHGACNSVVGLLTPEARRNPQPVLDELEEQLDAYGVFAVTPLKLQFSNLTLCSEMNGLKTMATMLPLMFLAVAALVLNVLMTRLAEQQRTIVGTFKALGYTNRQMFNHFLKYGLFVGIVGGVAGGLLGYWIAAGMTAMYSTIFEFPRLVNDIYPGLMAIALIISVTFAVLGTLRGVRQVVKLSPAEAMREPAPPSSGRILLERWQRFWSRIDFRWPMVLRGLFRNKVRTLIAMIAAAMGSALVVLAFGFVDSMNGMISFQFNKVLLSDFTLTFREVLDGGALYEAGRLPGVTRVEPVFNVACTFRNKNHQKKGAITGLVPGATLTVPRSADGTAVPVPPVGLLMTKRLAEQLDIRKGDTVRVVPTRGAKIAREIKVADTVDSMIGLAVYADYNFLNHLVDEESAISELQLKARQTPWQRAQFFRQLKEYPLLQSVGETSRQKAAITKQFTGAMQGMATMMILFAAVIFFGSILNGSLISMAERRREIATFRVLGYQPLEVGTIFIRENLVTNMIGALAGLPLGLLMLKGMMSQFCNDAFAMPTIVSPSTWLWTILLALLFVLVAQVIVQRSINKLEWCEALSCKE